ncbi:5-formyltetrahydrofolate cyclo-ligase [Daejeonella sp. H1SJ63]|uniref:5-formyltetrahydrofolate cyclo-ligase n=1 Tax=Daejeonella sp. H1SJ63 TaxID=3034145 RepID=UPI0023ED2EEA|nr:5-formyltetrahydrofolate cyclo-ligase [Daejeonella sp. H1SJ63]
MDKATLRKQFLERRQNLSRARYWMLTEELMEQVKLVDWSQFRTIHVFLPIRKHNEIDTFSILNYFKQAFPDLRILIPRTNFEKLEMENVLYDHDYTILGRNKFDIPEPIHGKIISSDQIDLVFVPLIVFDKKGNRAGYGKGFYDRFLSKCRHDVHKMGLSYFDPVDEITGLNEFDIKLDSCICPGKIWEF